ncbi:MAG: hypothetical protein JWL73_1241 [Actinomycetia bacterium]|nr:hypothetical protein [Actinomycetes bacterium]
MLSWVRENRLGQFAVAALVITLAACTQIVGPARTYQDYERKAGSTAKSVLSAVQTSRLTLRLGRQDKSFAPYLSVMASESEDTGAGATATFSGIQPPDDRAEALGTRLEKTLQEASSALTDVRVRARRTQLGTPDPKLERRLAKVTRQLDAFVKEHG